MSNEDNSGVIKIPTLSDKRDIATDKTIWIPTANIVNCIRCNKNLFPF